MSTDATCNIVERYMQSNPNIRLTNNVSRTTSSALNIGIQLARGEVIVRMDGHAEAPPNYISKSVNCLVKKKTDVVGCHMETVGRGYSGQRIAIALSSPFGVGNASYRVSNAELYDEPGWLGTFWRKSILNVGGYDEFYQSNEDCELSYRMLYKGYALYTPSGAACKYFCRTTLLSLWQQYYKYGFWKVAVISKLRKIPSLRHIVPALFLSTVVALGVGGIFSSLVLKSLLLIIGSYVSFTGFGSWKASKGKDIRYFWTIIPVFVVLHFSYGTGFLSAIFSRFLTDLRTANKSVHSKIKSLKQVFRPLIQNKVSAFVIYVADAAYDFTKYFIYSGNLYGIDSCREKLEALILMNAHKIEKVLTLKEPREIFEPIHIVRLIRLLRRYSEDCDGQDITFLSAYAALVKYQESFGAELEKILTASLNVWMPS